MSGTPGEANFAGTTNEFVTETLLATGAAVTALVPSDDSLGTSWINPDFVDDAWLNGTTGVGYERDSGYESLLGLDLEAPPDGQTPMPMFEVNSSVYVRVPFSVSGDPAQFDSLVLKMKYDDGFVAYLNGTEVARDNAPEDLGWSVASTGNRPDGSATSFANFDITAHLGLLSTETENVLAIQGLNAGTTSSDLLLLPEIEGRTNVSDSPGESTTIGLTISEVAGSGDANFFVEIANTSDDSVDLDGFVLAAAGSITNEYVFPAGAVAAGQSVSVSAAELGFSPADGDRLFLYRPDREEVVDARRVTGRLRGQSLDHNGDWLWPDCRHARRG